MLTEKSTSPSKPSIGVGRGGVSQWNIVFGCVRVGYRYTENEYLPHVLIVFPRVRPKGEVRVVVEEP